MHACGHSRWRLVANRYSLLHERGAHAGKTHKHDNDGKNSVYEGAIVRMTILHIHR